MPNDGAPASALIQGRARAVGAWLARPQATAPSLAEAMMGRGCLTIHRAGDGMPLSLDWSGPVVVVQASQHEGPHRFHDLRSALAFFEAVLLSHAAGAGGTGSAPGSQRPCGRAAEQAPRKREGAGAAELAGILAHALQAGVADASA